MKETIKTTRKVEPEERVRRYVESLLNKKTSGVGLMIFALIYNTFTLAFIGGLMQTGGGAMLPSVLLPVFWALGILVLIMTIVFAKIKIKNVSDWVFLFFSTPLPLFAFLGVYAHSENQDEKISPRHLYYAANHYYKEDTYRYPDQKIKRLEFYVTQDIVSEEDFHTKVYDNNLIWLKDSVWTYYNEDGSIQKREKYSKVK